MEIPKFLKLDNDALIYNTDGQLVYHVPEVFFENKCAVIIGEYVSLIGIFSYELLNSNGKSTGIKNFYFPSRFMCKPSEIESVKGYKLFPESDPCDYRFLRFNKGDEAVNNINTPQDITNVEDIYRMMVVTGKVPETVKYSELQNYFLDSMDINGGNYKVNGQMFGIVIGELCRQKHDISKPFRQSKDKLKHDNNFTSISIKEIPKYTSPFAAITSENWDESVVAAIMNDNEREIPLEKVLTK